MGRNRWGKAFGLAAAAIAVTAPASAQAELPHVVQPGETLWSIAAGLLSHGASDAEVAAMVQRLWELNAERIHSGDPDLIVAGEELGLPR